MRSALRMVLTRWATITTAASTGLGRERSAQCRVRGVVECGERVVEAVDARPADDRPGDREPLALTARDVAPTLRNGRIEPVWHRLDEAARLRDLERAPQLLIGGVGVAVTQVGGDRPREEVRPLRHQPR